MDIDDYANLKPGWDSYNAPPISQVAIYKAKKLLEYLKTENLTPTRIRPSVVGAVGITFHFTADYYIYIEIYNKGHILCAVMDDFIKRLDITQIETYEQIAKIINDEIMFFAENRSMHL